MAPPDINEIFACPSTLVWYRIEMSLGDSLMALVAAREASAASSAIGGAPAPGQPATDEINQLDAAQSRHDGQSGDGSQKCDGKGKRKGKGKGKPSAV